MKKPFLSLCVALTLATPMSVSASTNTTEEMLQTIPIKVAASNVLQSVVNTPALDQYQLFIDKLVESKQLNHVKTPTAAKSVIVAKKQIPSKSNVVVKKSPVLKLKPIVTIQTLKKSVQVTPVTNDSNPVVQPVQQQPNVTAPIAELEVQPEPTSVTQPVTESTTTPQQSTQTVTNPITTGIHAYEQEVLDLTNAERAKQGLTALQADTKLMAAAREKSVDMQQNNYFSHTSPTFGSPFDRLKALGITYRSAGENIAQGQRTPAEVVQAWMNSPGHRANILNANYTHLGVGYVAQGNYWTQQFIQK